MSEEKRGRGRPKNPEPKKDDVQSFSVRLPKPIHKTLKLVCTAKGTEMNEAVIEAVTVWLRAQPEYKQSEALGQVGS